MHFSQFPNSRLQLLNWRTLQFDRNKCCKKTCRSKTGRPFRYSFTPLRRNATVSITALAQRNDRLHDSHDPQHADEQPADSYEGEQETYPENDQPDNAE